MEHVYKTQMVCSTEIAFDLDGDVVRNIRFTGGCNGNLKALSKVLDGWTVGHLKEKLEGNTCGRRPTSCADQLVKAVVKAYEEENA